MSATTILISILSWQRCAIAMKVVFPVPPWRGRRADWQRTVPTGSIQSVCCETSWREFSAVMPWSNFNFALVHFALPLTFITCPFCRFGSLTSWMMISAFGFSKCLHLPLTSSLSLNDALSQTFVCTPSYCVCGETNGNKYSQACRFSGTLWLTQPNGVSHGGMHGKGTSERLFFPPPTTKQQIVSVGSASAQHTL